MWCSNVVSRGIFCYRRAGKIGNDTSVATMAADTTVGSGQGVGLLKEIGKYESKIGAGSLCLLNNIESTAQIGRGLGAKVAKGALWASEHVDPLIAVATGIKILTSDDKEKAAYTDGTALCTMFAGEHLFKKFFGKIAINALLKSAGLVNPLWGTVISGLAFVGTSLGAWAVGSKIGKNLYNSFVGDNKTQIPKTIHPFLKNTQNKNLCFSKKPQSMFHLTESTLNTLNT